MIFFLFLLQILTIKQLFLNAFYASCKLLAKVVFWFFYSKTTVLNREKGDFEGATIVVSNHPATMLDPLNVVTRVSRMSFFLANASLFKTRFNNWFFNTFYCIPVERYKDTGGKPLNNADAFRRAIEHLSKGNILFLCPEGLSETERHLRPIKTGCGRIALATEQAHDFQLNLRILPVGLTYTDGRAFRDKVIVNFGDRFKVSDFQQYTGEDGFEAVRELTEEIERRLSDLIINAKDRTEDLFLQKLEIIQQTNAPLAHKEHYFRTKKLLKNYHKALEKGITKETDFKAIVNGYFNELNEQKINDFALKNPKRSLGSWLLLFVSFFPFLFGFLNNYLSIQIPSWIDKKFAGDSSFSPTFKVLSGLILLPLFYFLQTLIVHLIFGNWWITLGYFLLLLPSFFIAEWWWALYEKTKKSSIAATLKKKNTAWFERILSMRNEIEKIMAKISE